MAIHQTHEVIVLDGTSLFITRRLLRAAPSHTTSNHTAIYKNIALIINVFFFIEGTQCKAMCPIRLCILFTYRYQPRITSLRLFTTCAYKMIYLSDEKCLPFGIITRYSSRLNDLTIKIGVDMLLNG